MAFYNILNSDLENNLIIDDRNALGAHIIKHHGKTARGDFDKIWKFYVIKRVDPVNLRIEEQKCIDRLKTLVPNGFNTINSVLSS